MCVHAHADRVDFATPGGFDDSVCSVVKVPASARCALACYCVLNRTCATPVRWINSCGAMRGNNRVTSARVVTSTVS